MKKLLYTAALVLSGFATKAQVGIGTATPDASSMLHIVGNPLLFPRISGTTSFLSPTDGIVFYDTTANSLQVSRSNDKWFNLLAGTEITETAGAALAIGNVGIGTSNPDGNAALDVATKGIILPILASDPTGVAGMMYYNSTSDDVKIFTTSWITLNKF